MSEPTIAQISAFFAVYAHGSTVKAAKVLNRSQSNISANLTQLEKNLGFPLFVRENGRLRATQQASSFAPRAERLIEAHQAIVSMSSKAAPQRLFSIGAPRSLSMTLLPRLIRDMAAEPAAPQIRVLFQSYEQIVEDVAEGRLDVGIAKIPVLDPRVIIHPVCVSPSVVVMPVDHPLAQLQRVTPRDLGATPLIRLGTGMEYWEKIVLAFREQGLSANFSFEIGGVGPACRLVEEGLGLAIVNQMMAAEYVDLLKLTARPFAPTVDHTFVWLSSAFSSNAQWTERFASLLKAHLPKGMQVIDAAPAG